MNEKNKKIILVVGVLIAIIIVSALAWYGQKAKQRGKISIPLGGGQGQPQAGQQTGLPTVEGGTREKISKQIEAPEAGATSTNPDIAVPKSVINLGGVSTSASLRDFEIKAEKGKFSPSTIVVNEMDVITISLTAVDAKYNIFFPDFGVYREAEKGQTIKFQFQAYPYGQYKFYCKDICGARTEGTLIVNKK